jgi:hypothetical protein
MYRDRTKPFTDNLITLKDGVFGSTRASKFVQDLANGIDSIDFLVVGDSNTGSAVAGMWGYHNGLSEALNNKGWQCYGTSVFPIVTEVGGTGIQSSTANGWRCGASLIKPWNGVASSGQGSEPLRSGNSTQAQTDAPDYYNMWSPAGYIDMTAVNPVFVRYGSSGTGSLGPNIDSWAFLSANSASYFNSYGMGILENHPLAVPGTPLYYRIKYGKFLTANNTTVSPSQNGGFCPVVFKTSGNINSGGTELTSRSIVSSLAANAGEVGKEFINESTFTTATQTGYRAGWAYVGSGTNKTCGPIALHSQSIYAKRKGWAVTSLTYLGGYNSESIAGVLAGVKNTSLKALLREIRERQRDATGSGRVIIVAQSGVNSYPASPGPNYETPDRWTTAYTSIWDTIRNTWTELGYPENDIAIVAWVSHPISSADGSSGSSLANNLISVRAAAGTLANNTPGMTIIDIKSILNYNQLVRGNGNGQSLFQYWNNSPVVAANFPAHLAGGGVSTAFGLTGGKTEEFAGNATFVDGSSNPGLTLTNEYATLGTVNNQFRNAEIEIVKVGYVNQGALTSVTCAGTAGQFTCASAALAVNRVVVISGTIGGITIAGYTNPTTYYITATNGSTTFTLSTTRGGSGVATTGTTPTGLTFSLGLENLQPQRTFITEYDATTKFAKVAAWPMGTPSSSNGGITPLPGISAAANKDTYYRLNLVHPADGYTMYMDNMLSVLNQVTV